MLKKNLFVFSLLGTMLPVYAGTIADETMLPPTVSVTIPQQTGSWNVGIEGHYFQTANNDGNIAIVSKTGSDSGSGLTLTKRKTHSVDMEHEWGGRFDLTYHFAGNGRDVSLVWNHRNDNQADQVFRKAGESIADTLERTVISPTFFPNGVDYLRGKLDNDLDSIDLLFGQKMHFADKVTLRAFGGVRYADINAVLKANVEAEGELTANNPLYLTGNATAKSDYEGLGPRAGIDANIAFNSSGISLFGTIAGSLLVGDLDQHLDFNVVVANPVAGTTTTNVNKGGLSSSILVVPELDARIGIDYKHDFTPDTAVSLGVGYEVSHYFNAVNLSEVSYLDSMRHYNDFANYGPFVRLAVSLS